MTNQRFYIVIRITDGIILVMNYNYANGLASLSAGGKPMDVSYNELCKC